MDPGSDETKLAILNCWEEVKIKPHPHHSSPLPLKKKKQVFNVELDTKNNPNKKFRIFS